MNSAKPSTPLDLEAGLLTRPEDVQALRQARRGKAMSLSEYLDFLRQFDDPPADVLRTRRGPRGDRPFVL
jgi:hypothetical protein